MTEKYRTIPLVQMDAPVTFEVQLMAQGQYNVVSMVINGKRLDVNCVLGDDICNALGEDLRELVVEAGAES